MNVTRAAQLGAGSNGKGPGPVYKPRYKMDSTLPGEVKVLFGTAPRFPSSKGEVGPGPGAYTIAEEHGVQYSMRFREKFGTQDNTSAKNNPAPGHVVRLETVMTRKQNAAAYSMRPRRLPPSASDPSLTPGPGHTQHVGSSVEKQVESTKPNLPGLKFGTGGRPKDHGSGVVVGPGEYEVEKADKSGLLGPYKNPPAYTLTGRPKPRKGDRVQPDIHQEALTKWQVKVPQSTLRSAPAFSLSGRGKFGDPYAT